MLTPHEIVEALDKYIIGQSSAKRAVAIALRNRYRRSKLPKELRDEITPKNIIMIGPTGVGKTEIARRLAKLVDAPLVKVEATKFTEVGYVGRDVDSMIRDLVEASIRICKDKKYAAVKMVAEASAEQRLVDLLMPKRPNANKPPMNPLQLLLSSGGVQQAEPELTENERKESLTRREEILRDLRMGKLEDEMIEIEVEQSVGGSDTMVALGIDINLNEMMGGILPKNKKKRKASVKDARRILVQEESEKLVDMDEITGEAIERAEQDGIIFIDEIDKIAGGGHGGSSGPDVSREGVQRDILPIVEGCTVNTKYGPVKTDFILFIAAGAFHVSKPTDLIPELQGRFPIRVELGALTSENMKQILTQPEHSITEQYAALLKTDNIVLDFTDDALDAIAKYAQIANETSENIGARRLHTILEDLLDDISFNAGGDHPLIKVTVDSNYVNEHLSKDFSGEDLSRFVL